MKKKVIVLAHALASGGGLSVGYNIVRCLNRSRAGVEYTFILPKHMHYNDIVYNKPHNVIWFENKYPIISRWIFDTFRLPNIIDRIKPNWILGLGNLGVPSSDIKQAILFHKPQLIYPSKHSVNEIWFKRLLNKIIRNVIIKSLKNTKIVYCQTKTASRRFRDTFNYHGCIKIWPNAVSSKLQDTTNSVNLPIPEKLKPWVTPNCDTIDFFILTRYYPHKNLELILEACKHYASELENARFFITIDGTQHPLAKKLLSDISNSKLDNKIINLGPINQGELAAYYYYTDALLLPTLLESFSGTYIEAMEFKKPILTSKLDFAEELCGDAALYFDPWSIESFVSTIKEYCNNHKLRDLLVSKGESQRLKYNFKWEETTNEAEKLLLEFSE